MVVDIDGLSAHITAQLLDELATHPRSPELGGEPVATAMGGEVVFVTVRIGVVKPDLGGPVDHQIVDSTSLKALVAGVDEECLAVDALHFRSVLPIGHQVEVGLLVEVDHSVAAFCRLLELDGPVAPIDIVDVDLHQLVPSDAGLGQEQDDGSVPWFGDGIDQHGHLSCGDDLPLGRPVLDLVAMHVALPDRGDGIVVVPVLIDHVLVEAGDRR